MPQNLPAQGPAPARPVFQCHLHRGPVQDPSLRQLSIQQRLPNELQIQLHDLIHLRHQTILPLTPQNRLWHLMRERTPRQTPGSAAVKMHIHGNPPTDLESRLRAQRRQQRSRGTVMRNRQIVEHRCERQSPQSPHGFQRHPLHCAEPRIRKMIRAVEELKGIGMRQRRSA